MDGRDYRLITLRPGTRARFSTNFYHDTWHILSDPHGTLLLSRLLWGLSYQRQPGTVVLIDRRFIDPNPFDAEPGDPIALIPANLTHLPARTANRLSRLVVPPAGTIRWHTWGLDLAAHEWRTQRSAGTWWRHFHPEPDARRAEITQQGNLLSLRASPSLLRQWAVHTTTMGDYSHHGMSYTELHGPRWELCRADGEVQTFTDYHQQVSVAKISRRELLATADTPTHPEDICPLVWSHNDAVRSRRVRAPA
ncbi:hypothetical protein [Nonomuraea sediminis]|uniref:hypothetical protein n=1 Tax=Nonomuraea sediminis TaxID=2835864 RepID=UPI001BDD655C|nr:hypothetical protein [Nonomuraea sediminis]